MLDPLQSTRTGGRITEQSACVATVVKGSKKSLRVSLIAEDTSNNIVAAVNGQ